MKSKETPRGTVFSTNNKFSKNLHRKDDRKLNSFLHFKYAVITKLHLQKLVKKKGWFRTLDPHWKEEPEEYQKKSQKDQVILDSEDLKLERIVMYDLIPKEYLKVFQEKYFGFKKAFIKKTIFDKRPLDIKNAFDKMMNSFGEGSWYNVDQFLIKKETSLGANFVCFEMQFIGLTKSFYIVRYVLDVDAQTNADLEKILKAIVHRPAFCVSNGKWWKEKSFAGCNPYMFGEAKNLTINDFLLELKAKFFKELKTRLLTFFFDWNNIIPSVEMYSSTSLSLKRDSIFRVLDFNSHVNAEKHKKETVYFIPDLDYSSGGRRNNSSKIIADKKIYEEKEAGSSRISRFDMEICQEFADFFVLSGISEKANRIVYESQLRIAQNVYKQNRFNTLIKSKLKIDKSLYYYRRLYNDLSELKFNNSQKTRDYLNDYANVITEKEPNYRGGFCKEYGFLYGNIKIQKELIDNMYFHFEENSKLLESRYNYRIVKWTLIVTALTLFVTILFVNDGALIEIIKRFFESIFIH